METQVAAILQEEREERALRKAEMEATKAENMIEDKDDIFSCPKRTWFTAEREKRLIAMAAKASKEKDQSGSNEVISAQKAEELKMKEKRQREREKNMPRKKRRRLETAREMLEDESQTADMEQAKSLKAMNKAREAGKIMRKKHGKSPSIHKRANHGISAKKRTNSAFGIQSHNYKESPTCHRCKSVMQEEFMEIE
ncbi:hypothetical protein MRB53_030039 [Persea americana]|uniref:Uncharacterized protein n=1 Tax=Persea americana TaxID=3435 RepID=A0ACC2KK35_PERAE|nr:hypothetical protein MRB53_030039 [Persea americana]